MNSIDFDFSKIVRVLSDTEKPIHNNEYSTLRAHCSGMPENTTILDRLENIGKLNILTDRTFVCDENLFKHPILVIKTLEELQKRLSDVLIRFDAAPSDYLKQDYQALLDVITLALTNLYLKVDNIITSWEEELKITDTNVPSAKLVKDSIALLYAELDEIDSTLEDHESRISEIESTIVSPGDGILNIYLNNTLVLSFSANYGGDPKSAYISSYRGEYANPGEISSPVVTGDFYINTGDNTAYVYNGITWKILGAKVTIDGYTKDILILGENKEPEDSLYYIDDVVTRDAAGQVIADIATYDSEGNHIANSLASKLEDVEDDNKQYARKHGQWVEVEFETGTEKLVNKVTTISAESTDIQYPSAKAVYTSLSTKLNTLISGTNIKTINGNSVLGEGNLEITSGLTYTAGTGIDITNNIISSLALLIKDWTE